MAVLKEELEKYDPMEVFIYALKAPESRRQYPRRFKPFLDFLIIYTSFGVSNDIDRSGKRALFRYYLKSSPLFSS
ncbi:MAG TPA: hypothetical protein VFH19_04245 [Nitrososphaeraceae archaeon]|nr:hypothetical protein [Nitrososphaeraceae archaeon]